MINRTMVEFMTNFESEMKEYGIENAIEISCANDNINDAAIYD